MLKPILLIPAYGKTYATESELRAAWDAGKDFQDWRYTGGYCSVRDLAQLSYLTSTITIVDPRSRISITIEPLDQWAHVPRKRGTL